MSYFTGKVGEDINLNYCLNLGRSLGYYIRRNLGQNGKVLIIKNNSKADHLIIALASGVMAFGFKVELVNELHSGALSEIAKQVVFKLAINFSQNRFNCKISIFNSFGEAISSDIYSSLISYMKEHDNIEKQAKYTEEIGHLEKKNYIDIYLSSLDLDRKNINILVYLGIESKALREAMQKKCNVKFLDFNDFNSIRKELEKDELDLAIVFDFYENSLNVVTKSGKQLVKDTFFIFLMNLMKIKSVCLGEVGNRAANYVKANKIEIVEKGKSKLSYDKGTLILDGSEDCFRIGIELVNLLSEEKRKVEDLLEDMPDYYTVQGHVKISEKQRKFFLSTKIFDAFVADYTKSFFKNERLEIKLSEHESAIILIVEATDKKRAYDIAYVSTNFIKRELGDDK